MTSAGTCVRLSCSEMLTNLPTSSPRHAFTKTSPLEETRDSGLRALGNLHAVQLGSQLTKFTRRTDVVRLGVVESSSQTAIAVESQCRAGIVAICHL
jgi:hypothetical protein